jgi:protein phosphatase PTC6
VAVAQYAAGRRPQILTIMMWTKSLPHTSSLSSIYIISPSSPLISTQRRAFHDYFITHLPSSSHHPDSRPPGALHHKLPRDKSTPHTDPSTGSQAPAATSSAPNGPGISRDLTVVRIPLKSAKHHFGAFVSRGQRPYNEDAYQAGTIELPAFTRRRPQSVRRRPQALSAQEEANVGNNPADAATGDPQVFYFGVFDGHGGSECSEFLRDRLHTYIEDAARQFGIESSLKRGQTSVADPALEPPDPQAVEEQIQKNNELQKSIIQSWKDLVGGYFRRFKPEFFSAASGGQEHPLIPRTLKGKELEEEAKYEPPKSVVSIETVLEWAFLKADYDFIAAQAGKVEEGKDDSALNAGDELGKPAYSSPKIGGAKRFLGGSTGSIALISTPTPTPFWHPAATSTIITSHCGDTRILLCDTASGNAIPLTATHHPNHPLEAQRMRRYAATFVTDSFGEERVGGLANTRAFGDMPSKRIGVSAEPEIVRVEVLPAQFSFLVLTSDGVCGQLGDQEIVDIVKESRTPEQGAKDVVTFATEVTTDGDNCTALVVRLGGWERRQEGGGGSMRTKEMREFRRNEAMDPRSRRT